MIHLNKLKIDFTCFASFENQVCINYDRTISMTKRMIAE